MKNWIRIEANRLFYRWQTWVGIGLYLLLAFLGVYIQYLDGGRYLDVYSNGYDMFLNAVGSELYSMIPFGIVMAVLLIWGDSFYQDFHTDMLKYNISRTGIKKYFVNKISALMILSFVGMFVLQIGMLGLMTVLRMLWYSKGTTGVGYSVEYLPAIYENSPVLYVFMISLVLSLVAVAGSLLGAIFSMFFKNVLGVIFVPWILMLVSGLILYAISVDIHIFLIYLSPGVMSGTFIYKYGNVEWLPVFYPFAYWGGLCIILYAFFSRLYKKKVRKFL